MNNANFGYDCRNNTNSAKFESIIDEVNKITYIKKYYNLFDSKISNFLNSHMLEEEIEQNFQQQIANVKHDNLFKSAKINSIKSHNGEDLNGLESLKNIERKSKKRKLTRDFKKKWKTHLKTKR